MLKLIINSIILAVVKVQFLPVRIANAMHIHKMKRELNQLKKQLNK